MGKNISLKWYIAILSILLIVSVLLSTMIGSVKLSLPLILKVIFSQLPLVDINVDWADTDETIIWDLRISRILLAILIGAMLSVSGTAFQGVLRNPLADPYILGVSSGAALGAAVAIIFFNQNVFIGRFTLSLFAFLGGIVSLGLVVLLSKAKSGQRNETLILAGVVIQSLTGAFLSFLIAISGEQMQSIIFWMMGSLANKDWLDVWILLPYFILGTLYLYSQHRELNVMALGEEAAQHLGIDVVRKKMIILLVASLLAASAVSIVGIIGFVGLVIPHTVRLITGPNHRMLLPVSILVGAIFLIWTDTLARTAIPSRELPIGIITAFIGAPLFAYFLRRGLRRGAS